MKKVEMGNGEGLKGGFEAMSAFKFPLGESAQRKAKKLQIEGKETLASGWGQGILDPGESPLLSPEYPVLFFSNTLDKACLCFSQMLIWGQNSGWIFCSSSSLLGMVRELSKKTHQASQGGPGMNYPLSSLFLEPVHTGASRSRSQGGGPEPHACPFFVPRATLNTKL